MKTPLCLFIALLCLSLGCQPPGLDEKKESHTPKSSSKLGDESGQSLEQMLDKSNAALAEATKEIIDITARLKAYKEKHDETNAQLKASQAEVAVLKSSLADVSARFKNLQTGMTELDDILQPYASQGENTAEQEKEAAPPVKSQNDKSPTEPAKTEDKILPEVKSAEPKADSTTPKKDKE